MSLLLRTTVLLAAAPLALAAQTRIAAAVPRELTGYVVDSAGQAVEGAQVHVLGAPIGTMTTTDGRYRLRDVPGDTLSLIAQAPGRCPVMVRLPAGRDTMVSFVLSGFQPPPRPPVCARPSK